jgi:ABC-2 type transport system permease protein
MSDQTSTPVAAPEAGRTRPLYWSVRRELWENSSVFFAPLALAALGLVGFGVSSFHLGRNLRIAETLHAAMLAAPGDAKAAKLAHGAATVLQQPYDFLVGSVFVTSMVVAIFYSLAALYNERRDRSVLFWKSLPVSDLTTVLSKAILPLAITPVVMLAVAIAGNLVMLAWGSAVLLAGGLSPAAYLAYLPFPFMWLGLLRGLLVMVLWYAPIVGWLMLVSGWARRVTILWALGPWAALCLFELLAFHSTNIWNFVRHRLAGGAELGFTYQGPNGRPPIETLAQLDLIPVLTNPEVLGGVVVAVLLFAGCVRQRRYRDPI